MASHLARRPAVGRRPAARPALATYDLDPTARRGRRDLQRPGDVPCASTATSCRRTWASGRRSTRTPPFWGAALAAWTGGTFLYVPRGVTVDESADGAHRPPRRGAYTYLPHHAGRRRGGQHRHPAGGDPLAPTAAPPGSAAPRTSWPDTARGCATRTCSAWATRRGTIGAQRVEVGQDADVTTLNAEVGSAIDQARAWTCA